MIGAGELLVIFLLVILAVLVFGIAGMIWRLFRQ